MLKHSVVQFGVKDLTCIRGTRVGPFYVEVRPTSQRHHHPRPSSWHGCCTVRVEVSVAVVDFGPSKCFSSGNPESMQRSGQLHNQSACSAFLPSAVGCCDWSQVSSVEQLADCNRQAVRIPLPRPRPEATCHIAAERAAGWSRCGPCGQGRFTATCFSTTSKV